MSLSRKYEAHGVALSRLFRKSCLLHPLHTEMSPGASLSPRIEMEWNLLHTLNALKRWLDP